MMPKGSLICSAILRPVATPLMRSCLRTRASTSVGVSPASSSVAGSRGKNDSSTGGSQGNSSVEQSAKETLEAGREFMGAPQLEERVCTNLAQGIPDGPAAKSLQ